MAAISAQPLKFLTIPALRKHTATIIFIHGLGDTGHGWQPVADMIREDPGLHHVKWILPHSSVIPALDKLQTANFTAFMFTFLSLHRPSRPVTANLGQTMPSWFDIDSFGFNTPEDEKGMLDAKKLIEQLVTDEVDSGTPSSRILLGGFSQGGAMSILVGLTGNYKFAALAVLSSWLPVREKFEAMASPHASSTPIFWGYGSNDPLIRPQLSKESVKTLEASLSSPRLKSQGASELTVKVYEGMGHEACYKELDDLKRFIMKYIPADA